MRVSFIVAATWFMLLVGIPHMGVSAVLGAFAIIGIGSLLGPIFREEIVIITGWNIAALWVLYASLVGQQHPLAVLGGLALIAIGTAIAAIIGRAV